jgi:hypothetical protein
MDDATRDAADRLATSRIVPLDQTLQRELAEIAQDLISRGCYNSSTQVTNTKSAGERNLVERAELISNTIKEVCASHNIRSAPTLVDDLKNLFDEIYEKQRAAVQRHVEKVVPEQNQNMCPINQVKPDVNRYVEELGLFAETLKHQKSETNFIRELIGITIVFLLILGGFALAANTLEWWMIPVSLAAALMAFIVIVAVALRRSGDVSEPGFAKIILAIIEKLPRIPWSSAPDSDTPDDSQNGA